MRRMLADAGKMPNKPVVYQSQVSNLVADRSQFTERPTKPGRRGQHRPRIMLPMPADMVLYRYQMPKIPITQAYLGK